MMSPHPYLKVRKSVIAKILAESVPVILCQDDLVIKVPSLEG
jgi:hypothetical protein